MRWLFVLTALGCSIRPFTLQGSGVDGNSVPPFDGGPGSRDGSAAPDVMCVPMGADNQCDNIDNDCDGIVDNDFDKQNDPENCGTCGHRCEVFGEIDKCIAGVCQFEGCQPGYADLNPKTPGCEYRCPVFPPRAEDCNGLDDDCNGVIDDPDELTAPTGACRTTPGTPCAGTTMICATRGGTTTWFCDYPSTVEFDPSIPNGIVLDEQKCDGFDGDCDGVADDPWPDVGEDCDNGLKGACRDGGKRVCDPVGQASTLCDLTLPPDPVPGAPMAETCNGVDDDCDGVVDNGVHDDMIEIKRSGKDFWIDRFEASRPDATSASAGSLETHRCANQDVVPWTRVSKPLAAAACAATGKRLCTAAEWELACGGPTGTAYPYGDTYAATTCNGVDDLDALAPTGSIAACMNGDGVFDLSGNAKEWTSTQTGDTGPPNHIPILEVRGGAYDTPAPGLTCAFDQSRAESDLTEEQIGFRCCSDAAP